MLLADPMFFDWFFRRVRITPSCWLWESGVSQYQQAGKGTQKDYVYRLSYKFYVGAIPAGLLIRHKCDNPRCVNPDHLETGTHKQNTQDSISRGRYVFPHIAILSEKEVLEIHDLWHYGVCSQGALGRLYGVTASAIHAILKGKSWKAVHAKYVLRH